MEPDRQPAARTLIARSGDRWCAIPLSRIRRVIPAPRIHPLPGASEAVAGLAEVDGEPLVVLSLRHLVGAATGPTPEHPVTLIVAAGPSDDPEILGLAVDEAGDITRLGPDDLVGTPRGLVRGESEQGDRVLDVLDLGALEGIG